MKWYLYICFCFLMACNSTPEQEQKTEAVLKPTENKLVANTRTDAAKYQQELYAFYNNPETTPLSEKDKKDFKGILFFPMNDKFVLEAKYEPIAHPKVIQFPTSANNVQAYKELGLAYFEIDGIQNKLTLYEPAAAIAGAEDLVFVPFKDATSGMTSYGAGRYLELSKADLKQQPLIIDFNRAYNPYCAYSEDYNCPIPPGNNMLKVKIEAGVRYDHL